MARPKHITAFRNGLRYQRAVPRGLRETVGRRNWLHELGDVNNATAAVMARDFDAHYDAVIERLRALPPDMSEHIRAAGGLARLSLILRGQETFDEIIQRDLEGDPAPVQPKAPTNGKALDTKLFNARDLLSGKAARGAINFRRQRKAAKPTLDALNAAVAELIPPENTVKLASLVDRWETVAAPRSPRTAKRMHLYLRRFVETVGEVPPRSVTAAHARQFRDALAKDPRIKKSAAKHIHALSRLFNIGVSEGLVDTNPFQGIKALRPVGRKLSAEKGKKPFSVDQARAILAALETLDLTQERWRDFRHILRLLIYHGPRSGELCVLRPEDIVKVEGIHVMRLHDEADGVTIKTEPSIRDVPIHPACRDFQKYVEDARKQGRPWVFNSLPTWDTGRAGKFQQMASKFLRDTIGITDKKITMHSARHYWIALARAVGMDKITRVSITGHSMGSDDHDGTYGSAPSLKVRYEWLKKIDPTKA